MVPIAAGALLAAAIAGGALLLLIREVTAGEAAAMPSAAALPTTLPHRPAATSPPATAAPAGTDPARHLLSAADLARGVAAGLVPPGTRSVLNVPRSLSYGQFVWDEGGAGQGPVTIRIDLRLQMLSAYRGGDEIGTAVILYGTEAHRTPTGRFPIRARLRDHSSSIYDAEMPYTLKLTDDGIAIHASDVRQGRATHGCIGLPLPFARRLFDAVRVGDAVDIVRSTPLRPTDGAAVKAR